MLRNLWHKTAPLTLFCMLSVKVVHILVSFSINSVSDLYSQKFLLRVDISRVWLIEVTAAVCFLLKEQPMEKY